MSSDNPRATFDHGAEYLKVALQVNPYQYLIKNGKRSKYQTEAAYNKAIVASLVENDIDMIAVTDHWSIADSLALLEEARENGIVALPGFEVESSDGVHVLCIFDDATTLEEIERCIGACQKPRDGVTLSALFDMVDDWNAVSVTAHITTPKKGLLGHLKGRPRKEAWTHPKHIAASLSVSRERITDQHRRIIDGTQSGYQRDHPVAIVYAKDVMSPESVARKTSWSWARMSSASLEGLRQAFLDPESRIRLPEDYDDRPARHIRSVSWSGGFLDGVTLQLNPALNVAIGPRGAGKSTVLESIRFALGLAAIGDEAQAAHDGFVQNVLGSGAEVTLEVLDPSTSSTSLVVRSVGGEPVVLTKGGVATGQSPAEAAGLIQVLGQHEIAELAKGDTDRTQLLRRSVPRATEPTRSRREVAALLATNREKLIKTLGNHRRLAEKLEEKASLESRIDALKKAGVEDTLDRDAKSRAEEPLFERVAELIDDIGEQLGDLAPLDVVFLEEDEISELPSESELTDIRLALEKIESARSKATEGLDAAIATAREVLDKASRSRQKRVDAERKEYLRKLRQLKQEQIDGEEFVLLVGKVASLVQKAKKLPPLEQRITKLREERDRLLVEWRKLQERDYEELRAATRVVNEKLSPHIRTSAFLRGRRAPLKNFLERGVKGHLNKVFESIENAEEIDPVEFADAVRSGSDNLKDYLGWHGKQAENVADELSESQIFELEELWLEPTTSIDLNVGSPGEKHVWRALGHLSTGQKATAILLVILLDSGSNAPLIIDQLEDDLDSDFIADSIVPQLRSEKANRQFILSTHNPNIPVLGDAEQVVRLTAEGEAATGGRAVIRPEHTGSMDVESIKEAVASLEGGHHAFERRRRRYGY
jgi:PHP family Zn ribbon phosphoesterase